MKIKGPNKLEFASEMFNSKHAEIKSKKKTQHPNEAIKEMLETLKEMREILDIDEPMAE